MIPLREALSSSIGKKLLTTLTGLGLVIFVITHLAGNLTLLAPTSEPFNTYAVGLERLGPLLLVAEAGLAALFIIHIVNGVRLAMGNRAARPVRYRNPESKGGPTPSNFASRNMALTGIVLTIFLVIHVLQFRLGPGMSEGYLVQLQGEDVRDLHRLVAEMFSNPWIVLFYVASMVMLWNHLRHGFWSAFQSLGAMNPRISGTIYVTGFLLAVLLAVGFIAIPVVMYARGLS